MARGINKVTLIGHLGADPEIRYTAEGIAIARVRIATSDVWKDKQTQALKEQTEWHRVIFFKGLADIAAKYLKKGTKIYLEGKLRTRKWQDKSGQERYVTEILASELQMLDSKTAQTAEATTSSAEIPDETLAPEADAFDDDIPF